MTNFTEGGMQTETFQEVLCSTILINGIRKHWIYLSVFNIFLSITAFLGNFVILVALHKESSLHPPSKLLFRSLATTDLCVGLIVQPTAVIYFVSLVHKHWSLCRYAFLSLTIASYTLSSVSLLTLAAISVDRLLALMLGLRYRQVVTLKRTYVFVVTFWVVSGVAAASHLKSHLIRFWYGLIIVPLYLVTSIASYAKIFCALDRHHTQVQNHNQQQPNQALNIARYRKAVYSALWVQLVLVVCYLPYNIVRVLTVNNAPSSSYFLAWSISATLVYLNSSLNPFLYCWKISEVRQAVKETIRQALCCPWS